MNALNQFFIQTWLMIAEMGPYLILGLAISALLHRVLRRSWVEGLMGKPKLSSIVWGSVVGVPMPLCSCGVIPVTMSLRNKGASNGAAVSFLTSTPQTGVDSFLATYGLLGPVFAVYKIIVAFASGILVGLSVQLFDKNADSPPKKPAFQKLTSSSPVASGMGAVAQTAPQPETPTVKQSLRYGFVTMPGDLANALLVGFLLAGLIAAFAPADLLSDIPGGVFSAILLATVISVPFYICSTGSIPLALALVHSGLPISAALVLLIAGPATNVTTILAMRKILGGRSTVFYVLGVVLTTWIAAAVYHALLDTGTLGVAGMSHHMEELPLWKHLGGAALLALLLYPKALPLLKSKKAQQPARSPSVASDLKTVSLKIAGMNCSHCESSIRSGLSELAFAPKVVSVDRQSETAIIRAERFDESATRAMVESLGFEYKGSKEA
ncbi:permease [Pelagicoccus sp. SDUM812003]|uniref:permease n=1 Tax=Pelagicoccus sp. SDUM812003 TaxID=3041267 RepID=UPI00280F846A|nr:permease [Pelagicoccus sp. SDUM812003]MDQ8203423.1 permease [Pelagicoccus sp. SDUM812003]